MGIRQCVDDDRVFEDRLQCSGISERGFGKLVRIPEYWIFGVVEFGVVRRSTGCIVQLGQYPDLAVFLLNWND